MSILTPGVRYLLVVVPIVLLLPVTTYTVLTLWAPLKISLLNRLFLSLVVVPTICVTLRNAKVTYFQQRAADRLGAQLVPRCKGKWIGNIDIVVRIFKAARDGYLGDIWTQLIAEHGQGGNTINIRFLYTDQIMTTEPEYIKTILATDFNNYEKGSQFGSTMRNLLGSGIFNTDGELWKFHRSISRPFFIKERITDFEIFQRHADAAIDLLQEISESGSATDIQDMAGRFTLDSATEFLFGQCVDSLSSPLPIPANRPQPLSTSSQAPINLNNRFAEALGEAQLQSAIRNRALAIWPLFEILEDKTKKSSDVLRSYIDPILTEALRKKKASVGLEKIAGDEERNTLLDHLVDVTDDKTIIQDELVNMLIAGRDTTSTTITIAIYLLTMHPEVLTRLRKEVIDTVGSVNPPTYDDLREMKYLRAVINETLRIFPPVPYNTRTTINETTWPGPNGTRLYIPPGAPTNYSVLLMHRRQDLWGSDSLTFDPERWLDRRLKDHLTPNPMIFAPFNAGPRICLGQQFAYNESSFFLVRFLQRFSSLSLDPEAFPAETRPLRTWRTGRGPMEKFWPRSHLTLYSWGGMWMKLGVARDDEV